MQSEDLLVHRPQPEIVLIQINRPERRNALGTGTLRALVEAIEGMGGTGVAVVTGVDEHFSAGADLEEIEHLRSTGTVADDPRPGLWSRLRHRRVPLIAAVRGLALGGGCELAMSADIAVAGLSARFGQPEVKLGFIPGAGGTQRLPRLAGKAVAMKMVLTGQLIGAEEALRAGLVAEVVPDERVVDRALELARMISANPPLAVAAGRRAVEQAFELPLEEGLAVERSLFEQLFATEDMREGIAAFREKRPPRFSGR